MIEGNELNEYLKSLAEYNEIKDIRDTAFMDGEKKGKEIGREEGKIEGEQSKAFEIAGNLLDLLDDETIALKTGLSVEMVAELRKEHK
jgi:predicted transposase YdaD